MAKQQNQSQKQQQTPISVSIEIGGRITLPSGDVQIPVKVITMAGDVRKSVALIEVTANGVLLGGNVQTDGRTGEFGGLYDLPTGVTSIKVVARYYNGKAVVSTENNFPVPKPEPAKVARAAKIILGTPVLVDGYWAQKIQTVTDDDKLIEETVHMDLSVYTLAELNHNNTTTQEGTDMTFKITGGTADLFFWSARYYFEITYSLPGGAGSVKQKYREPKNL